MTRYRAGDFTPLTLTDRNGPEWARPLPCYVGLSRGIRDSRPDELRPKAELLAGARLDGLPVLPQTTCPEVAFIHDAEETQVFIQDRATGRAVGVVGRAAMPYVDPDFRGRGYGSLGQYLVEGIYRRFAASSYSPEGVMNRAAVHKHHINAALAQGHTIPEDVLADYVVADGKARLRDPYTAARHLALRDRDLRTRNWDAYTRITDRMSFETELHVRVTLLQDSTYGAQAAYAVARLAQANPGFRLLRTEIVSHHHAYGLLDRANGRVIDAYGVRPANAYAAELGDRLRRRPESLKCTSPRKPWAEGVLATWSRPVAPETEEAIAEISDFLVHGPAPTDDAPRP